VLNMDYAFFPIIGEECNLPLYMTSIGIQYRQIHITRPSGLPIHQVIFCTGGSGILLVKGKKYQISSGQGFFIYPGISHEYYPVSEPWETHWITFRGSAIADLFAALCFENKPVFTIYDLDIVDNLFKQIIANGKSKLIDKGYFSSALLYTFLITLKSAISEIPLIRKENNLNQILPVISYIDINYNRQLSLKELADEINVSPQYLCRLFKQCYGMRPFEYVTKKRLQEAKKLLLENKLTVSDIAGETGYNDASYFCAVFKHYERITPNEFRALHNDF
jgi:AraC family transcriptional regulator of arabinose operon